MSKNQDSTLLDGAKKSGKSGVIVASVASGVAGAAAGVGTSALHAQTVAGADAASDDAAQQGQEQPMQVAQNHDDMSFGQAFAAARAEVGPGGIFKWHGRYYGTYTKEEWNGMSADARQSYADRMPDCVREADDSWQHGHATARVEHHTAAPQEHHAVAQTETDKPSTPTDDEHIDPDNPSDGGNGRMQVLDVTTETTDEGQQMIVAQVRVEGHDGVLIDTDMDGRINVAAIDFNDNGQLDEGEMGNVDEAGIRVDQLQQDAQITACGNDLPDYTNDADVSALV